MSDDTGNTVLMAILILVALLSIGLLLAPIVYAKARREGKAKAFATANSPLIEIENGTGERAWLDRRNGEFIEAGTVRYSPFFGHYVEVVTFNNDNDWSFRFPHEAQTELAKKLGTVALSVHRSRSAFSSLPMRGPERVGLKI